MAMTIGALGTFRVVHVDAGGNMIAELMEKNAGEFGITGRTAAILTNAEQMPKVKKQLSTILREDDKLQILYSPAQVGGVDKEDTPVLNTGATVSVIRIPITHRNLRSGVVYEKTLKFDDFTDKIGTIAPMIKGVWYNMFEYVVPAQTEIKLGHVLQDVRVDGAMNIAVELTSIA